MLDLLGMVWYGLVWFSWDSLGLFWVWLALMDLISSSLVS